MPTDEMIASQRQALEREKKGYANRLAIAKQNENSEKVERYQGLIKGVEKALKNLESQAGSVIDGSVDDVLERVGDDPELARKALELESDQKKPRSTLIEGLQELLEG